MILLANGSHVAEHRGRLGYRTAGKEFKINQKVQNKTWKNMNWRDFKYEDGANDGSCLWILWCLWFNEGLRLVGLD